LINSINKFVKPNDILYHLGDFGFGFNKVQRFKEIREAIKCENIYLILGNHDHVFEKHSKYAAELTPLFKNVYHLLYKGICKQYIVMCHYAMKTWPWQHQGSWNLYGHSHGNLEDDKNSLSLDVGVDTCLYGHVKYTPYSFEEIQGIMSQKKFTKLDHHA
jgi:calcineurin-like phosphoesterase family protein